MLTVSRLFIYPIKSLAGISCSSVRVTDRGFEHDRRWMLVDETGRFLSQREVASMALLQVTLTTAGLKIYHPNNPSDYLEILFGQHTDTVIPVTIWDNQLNAVLVEEKADQWFSEKLGIHCRLVYMKDEHELLIDPRYNIDNSLTSFSDGFPILATSEASLSDVCQRSNAALEMERFRPNLVLAGDEPYIEDRLGHFIINEIDLYGVKPSARCVITTIDPATAIKGKEPLATLAKYRSRNNKIYFGENVIAAGRGIIQVGDEVNIVKYKASLFES